MWSIWIWIGGLAKVELPKYYIWWPKDEIPVSLAWEEARDHTEKHGEGVTTRLRLG